MAMTCAAICHATETVYLLSGFSIVVDSHTNIDSMCVMHVGGGTVSYPFAQVSSIVAIPDPAPEPAAKLVQPPPGPEALLKRAAQTQGVDEILVRAVAKIESGLRQEAVSNRGALGLMQLMPGTAALLGVNPKQADQNAAGGAKYLRTLLERYRYNPALALAAYNAGPGAVARYKGVPPYYETRTYVVRVLREYERQLKLAAGRPVAQAAANGIDPSPRTPSATN